MTANLERDSKTDLHRPLVALVQDTFVPDSLFIGCESAGKPRERHARRSRSHDRTRSGKVHVSVYLQSKLRNALITLIQLESAEPFLCEHNDHGLLGLRTIEQRLDEGRYADAESFWSDIDGCLCICDSCGRYPFMVWEMRACFQQLEEDFWALKKKNEACLVRYKSVGRPRPRLVQVLVDKPWQVLNGMHEKAAASFYSYWTACDACD